MEILKHEQKPVIIADLMDISVFKIALHKERVIIYINYQIIKNRCEIYHARAISQIDGKLVFAQNAQICFMKCLTLRTNFLIIIALQLRKKLALAA